MRKLRVGVIGATGYVGQRFVTLLAEHPWFDLRIVAASARSAGKLYSEAVKDRWKLDIPMPEKAGAMTVLDAADCQTLADRCDFVFCAVDMAKDRIRALEDSIAKLDTPVVSNNSAHRWTEDVPMIIPEVNSAHAVLIDQQRKRLGTRRGFIVCKPNCSIQSYVPALTPLLKYGIEKVVVSTYQAISGAGKTFRDWPEMERNLIPYIGAEEAKSEDEPLKIWGEIVSDHGLKLAERPLISAQCYRVAVQEGHTASVVVKFREKPPIEAIREAWDTYQALPQKVQLPSAPRQFLTYFEENDRPQPKLDAMCEGGMGIAIGRLREDPVFDYKFVCLAHNTLRGAAGGAVETAELLVHLGYIRAKH